MEIEITRYVRGCEDDEGLTCKGSCDLDLSNTYQFVKWERSGHSIVATICLSDRDPGKKDFFVYIWKVA